MNSWNDGYFTESTYTYGYYRDISPTWQNFCLTANGFVADESNENSAHCELGFGQGVSINIHAASTPGKYFGTDFNPAHATHANKLLTMSGADAKFFDDSFEEMLNRDDLPQFDSISLHGIWTWISEENQNYIVEFARKFLKPGGVFYNSYNCYPGWSPGAPMRELFILYDKYAHKSDQTFNRVEEALKFTEELFSKNPAYFRRVPDVKTIFENTKKHNHDYLAHEYFNRDWICMYFSEVAEILQNAKLDFACVSEVIESVPNVNFPADVLEFLNKIENHIMREQIKDYFLDRQFRKDIYIRGSRRISDLERFKNLTGMNYVSASTNDLPKSVSSPMGQLKLQENVVEKIQAHLFTENYKPKNFADFIKNNPDVQPGALFQILTILAHSGNIIPCQSESAIKSVKKNCTALNKYICNRAKTNNDIVFLASPVTGSGIAFNRFERLFLSALFEGKTSANDMANYVWNVLLEIGQRLTKPEGGIYETAEENISNLKNIAENFLNSRLPIIKAMQII